MSTIRIIKIVFILSISLFGMDNATFEENISQIHGLGNCTPKVTTFINENFEKYKTDGDFFTLYINKVYNCDTKIEPLFIKYGSKEPNFLSKKIVRGDKTYVQDTTTHEIIGEYSEIYVQNKETLKKLFDDYKLYKSDFISRKDILDGLLYIAVDTLQLDQIVSLIQNKITYSKNHDYTWTTSHNKKYVSTETELLDELQQYIPTLMRKDSTEADKTVENIANLLIQEYPQSIYGYANLGSLYAYQKNYAKAKEYYKKALQIDQYDDYVIKNLEKIDSIEKEQLMKQLKGHH